MPAEAADIGRFLLYRHRAAGHRTRLAQRPVDHVLAVTRRDQARSGAKEDLPSLARLMGHPDSSIERRATDGSRRRLVSHMTQRVRWRAQ